MAGNEEAVGPDKAIYCFYERGGRYGDMFNTRALTLATLNLAWLQCHDHESYK